MRFVLVLLQLWQQSSERGFCIPHKAEVNLAAASELFTAKIDLHDGGVFGKELLIRKVRANHQQHFAVHHCVIAGRESEQTCHAHIERVVVLDELFSAHRVYDGSLQLAGELDQLVVSSGTTRTTKDRYLLRPIQQIREDVDLVVGRTHGRLWLGKMQPGCLLDGISQGHIARQGNHGNATSRDCSLHRNFEHAGHLLRLRDQLAVMAALREELLRMGLLKISTPDFSTGNLRGDGQDGDAAALTIVEAVDQMQVSRTAASGADGQFAGEMGFGASRECRRLFMAHMNPLESRSRVRIESVIPFSESPLTP